MKSRASLIILIFALVPLAVHAEPNNYNQRYAGGERAKRAYKSGDKAAQSIKDKQKNESKNGVNNDANLAADQSGSASGMNKAIGAALIAAGMAPPKPIIPLIMMGIMAMMQGGADSKGQNYATATGFDAYNGGADGKSAKGSGLSAGDQRLLDQATAALEDSGGKVNADGTITTGSGAVVSGNDFSDPDGLAEKGFDGKDIAAAKDGLGIASKAAKHKKISYGGGGGGGFKGYGNKEESYGVDGLSDGDSLLNELNRKSSVAGMTRSLASDRIGVAGDNIFDMLSRRYQAKDRARAFLP